MTSTTTPMTTAPAAATGRPSLLRVALVADAAVTGVNGLAYLVAAGPLADLLGLEAGRLRGIGAFLLAFAAVVAFAARTAHPARPLVLAIVAANALWAGERGHRVDRPAGGRGRGVRRAPAHRAAPPARVASRPMATPLARPDVGALLRDWRQRRRLSQLDLALSADVSARHLSFIETGRARPSADMVLRLAEHLDVPLRDRNRLLLAAGFAPAFGQRDLEAPEMGPVRDALTRLLTAHEPFPALVVDRHWGLVAANRALGLLTAGVAPELLEEPVNVLRLALHPDGLAPRIANLSEWRAHLLDRLGRQAAVTADPALAALLEELAGLPGGDPAQTHDLSATDVVTPLRLRHPEGELTFLSTITTFGTAADVTVAELSIEAFFPADEHTAATMRAVLGAAP
jgi:transcriptional regulator with XRE-family HTH domain